MTRITIDPLIETIYLSKHQLDHCRDDSCESLLDPDTRELGVHESVSSSIAKGRIQLPLYQMLFSSYILYHVSIVKHDTIAPSLILK